MKAKLSSVIIGLLFITNTQIWAQRKVTVEAVNDDISYYLDLKAVAYIFGESDNLEDFEYKLNDPENNLSNLDLNGDGYIDYLRVIETNEKNVHLVVIQAVLDRDVYQDVATIAVGKTSYNKLQIQVIGDPYIYGYNYIIEPYYYRTPVIVRWFWSPYYTRWYSPYYWGYYPRFYSYRSPVHINIYINHVHNRISRVNNHYNYSNSIRFSDYDKLHSSVRRNDFEKKNPDRAFSNRNREVQNQRELNPSSGRNDNRINNNNDRFGNRNDNGWRENSETNRRNDNYNRMNSTMPGNARVDNNNSQRNYRSESVHNENSGTRVNGNVSRENNGYNRENNNPSNDNRSGYENRNANSPQRENATTRTQSRQEQRSTNTETRQAPVRTQQQYERPSNTETRQAPTRTQQHVEVNRRSEPSPRVQPRQESQSTPRVTTPSRSTESSTPPQKTAAASRNNSENNNSNNQNTRR
jgi:hypothetical protein